MDQPYMPKALHLQPTIIPVEHQNVSDALSPLIPEWKHFQSIMISAQTGSGKNHFILKQLIPYAMSRSRPVILISNRIALNNQQKCLLLDALQMPMRYTPEQLQTMECFANVHVWSYQSVLHRLQYMDEELRYGYLILDEAHYFLSDAPFNSFTEQTLYRLLSVFPFYVHIYMTATPDQLYPLIMSAEQTYGKRMQTCYVADFVQNGHVNTPPINYNMTVYEFLRDYSDYRITFASDRKPVIDRMKRANSQNKWVYFLNNKNSIAEVARQLGHDQAAKFDASKRTDDNQEWRAIQEGQLTKNVLLTTSVIDNGVSLSDPNLHNIVIEEFDETAIIQMIGRKRKKQGEIVNVFLIVPSEDVLKAKLLSLDPLICAVQCYQINPSNFLRTYWTNLHTNIRNLFFINDQGIPVLNAFAYQKVLNSYYEYSHLLYKMQQTQDSETVFPKMVLGWLKGTSPDIVWADTEYNLGLMGQLTSLIDTYLENGVDVDAKTPFYNQFMEISSQMTYERPSKKNDHRSQLATLNRHMKILGLPYQLQKEKSRWLIQTTDHG